MKILSVTQNAYRRNFLTIAVEGNESFTGTAHKHGIKGYTMYCADAAGRYHEIQVRRQRASGGISGMFTKYYDTWCVGNGSGANRGWELNLTKREAFKIARARMAACQSMLLVAFVKISD